MKNVLPIKNFNDYFISNDGKVYSKKSNQFKEIKSHIYKNGYVGVSLYRNGKHYNKYIHRLVAETFIPNQRRKPQVNHKNGIKTDNRVKNLEWTTRSENMQHSFIILKHKSSMFGKFGKNNPKTKIIQQIKNGIIIAEFYGLKEAEKQTRINCKNISKVCLGQRKTAAGYQWQYK